MRFTRTAEDGTVTTITADYDFMGRRVCKKVETTSADPERGDPVTTVTSHQRSLYRGYLQIAALDLTRSTLNAFWYILWDPTEPVATRPLAIQTAGGWFTYGLDLTKNVTELYKSDGTIANAYAYEPFGGVTQAGIITNPLQWSSEVYDAELGMVYYNFRFYNPRDGRWISREPIGDKVGANLYAFMGNTIIQNVDILGLIAIPASDSVRGYIINEAARGVDIETIAIATGLNYCSCAGNYTEKPKEKKGSMYTLQSSGRDKKATEPL